MPSTVLESLTNLINSPPGQLAAGGVLAGIVWGFFERVENVLSEDTKLEIAVWLLGMKAAERVQHWPETFENVFQRLFGVRQLSLHCVFSTAIQAPFALGISLFFLPYIWQDIYFGPYRTSELLSETDVELWAFVLIFGVILPAFVMIWINRGILHRLRVAPRYVLLGMTGSVAAALLISWATSFIFIKWLVSIPVFSEKEWYSRKVLVAAFLLDPIYQLTHGGSAREFFVAPLDISTGFTSIWLWLYAGSGFILKAARRFDVGFQWFNSKLDIEKKPLQSIGLVSGALVAVTYWTAAIIRHFI